ncbi:MAG TPA: hypothetical protein VGJ85_09195 [Candidatus Nanopelagicaceae bacterium]|jgi:hypothetical protein
MLDSGIREVTGIYEPVKKARFRRLVPYLVTALIFSTVSFGAEYYFNSKRSASEEVLLVLHGGKAVDAKVLRNVVVANHLTVYWVGPENGAKYVLNAAVLSSISLRYLPAGSSLTDTTATYREVGTFTSPNAFAVTQKAGTLPNGVGFVNVDGNAVYYDSRDAKNVYIGLKDKDIQVEIFDPRPDQALASAIMRGQVRQIK